MGVRAMNPPGDAPRFGIIGTGAMAATMMATLARAGVHVAAVVSQDEGRARRFAEAFGIPDAYGHQHPMLARADIDAVYIANAAAHHRGSAIAALEAGKAVLCEKPLALDTAGGVQVAAAARKADRLCMEGLWTLFLPAYRRFIALAEAESCGAPGHLGAGFGSPEEAGGRLMTPDAGGVLLDRGGYLIALALKTLGPVDRVDAQLDLAPCGIDRHACLQLGHRGGGHSQLSVSFTTPLSNTARLAGPDGAIDLGEPILAAERLAIRPAAPLRRPAPLEAPDLRRRMVQRLRTNPWLRRLHRALPTATSVHLPYGPDPYLPEIRHFLDLMRAGRRDSDVVPLDLSLDILRIIDRAHVDHRRRAFREDRSRDDRISDELVSHDEHHLHQAGDRGARSARH